MAAGQPSEEAMALRKKLLRLDKNEVAKKCKKKNLSTMGTKGDMVDRLVEYEEEYGGVTGAREGSNKKKKKGSTASGKSGGKGGKSGGKGGSGGRGGRTNSHRTRDDDENGGGGGGDCYCYCGGGDDDRDDGQNTGNKRMAGGILGIICLILFIVAMALNLLSRYDENGVTVTCRWNEVRGCNSDNDCITVTFKETCNDCDGDCDGCETKQGGQWWLTFNILALIVILIGVIGIFGVYVSFKVEAFQKWVKVFFIIAAIFSFLAVIAWVGANDYDRSCYDTGNDLGLGASNIIDIVNGVLLIIGFILVF